MHAAALQLLVGFEAVQEGDDGRLLARHCHLAARLPGEVAVVRVFILVLLQRLGLQGGDRYRE